MHPNPPQGTSLLTLKAAANLPPRATEPPRHGRTPRPASSALSFSASIISLLAWILQASFARCFSGSPLLQPCWDTCSSLAQNPAGCGPLCQAGAPPAVPGAVPFHRRAGRTAPGGCGHGSRESGRCPACVAQPGLAPHRGGEGLGGQSGVPSPPQSSLVWDWRHGGA